ncbi:MAG: hypothetical protein D6795_03715 [Deltaproteobacteria bacterium]|nr:MAG: hypothetical protein D6795_03715 [Deltaproteobacteria bacterium]
MTGKSPSGWAILSLALLLFGWGIVPNAHGEETNIEYILDASGSMDALYTPQEDANRGISDQIVGWFYEQTTVPQEKAYAAFSTKLQVAKRVLEEAIARLPQDTRIGIRVLGAHVERGCNDTQLILPIGAHPPEEIERVLDGIRTSPFGRTPIFLALTEAMHDFEGLAGKNRIVVLTDAEATCPGDLSDVLAEIRKTGISVKIHVVGIKISSDEVQEVLASVAESTGGSFRIAKSKQELDIQLRKITPVTLTDVILKHLPTLLPLFFLLMVIALFLLLVWLYPRFFVKTQPEEVYPKWGKKRRVS